MQVLGTRSIPEAHLAARKFGRILQKLGYKPRMEDFTVQNIVASADTKMTIRLEGLQRAQPLYCKYEPELFPGLVYRILEPKMKVLVFTKGKLVFLGAKKTEDLERALELIYPVLSSYRMK